MEKTTTQGDFKEKEKVHVIPTREAEELHFSVISLNGKNMADIRYFSKTEEGVRPTQRAFVLDARKLEGLVEGAKKLLVALKK